MVYKVFGYVKPYVPDLRVRENEEYRALYCGLCRSMGKHTGCASRFTLSYDFVFLAALRCVLEDCPVTACAKRCMAHPLRRRPCICDNKALHYSAACAAVLTKAKVLDDIHDKHGIKRFGAKLLLPSASRMEKRALKEASVPRDEIYEGLKQLSALEDTICPSVDETAECFGRLLSAVFSFGLDGTDKRIAADIGMSIGKYIYVLDAADDAESDRKNGSYNPLNIETVSSEALSAAVRLELERAAAAVELIDTSKYPELGEIIKNTVYEGLVKTADTVFKKYERSIHSK